VFSSVSVRGLRVFALFLLPVAGFIHAQETVNYASLSGQVNDASGASIQGAEVVVRQVATNQKSRVLTDRDGRYRFAYLNVGDYEVQVHQPGFSDSIHTLTLTVGAAFNLPVTLSVGASQQTVEVRSQGPSVETARSEIAGTVTSTEIMDLPLNGRNYLDLALLIPNVSRTNTGSIQRFAETSAVPGTGISIGGQRNLANNFIVDGLSANDDAAELAGTFYGQEVIREFQVVTSGGTAEFGRALGGYVNILTQSGTNQFHGDVYGFLRNQRFDARNALSPTKLPLTQMQYGASLGGPIIKDQTFLFSNFEQTRQNSAGVIVITPANVSTINSKLASVGYPGATISTGQFPSTLDTTNYFAKVDHEVTDWDRLDVRYSLYDVGSLNSRTVGGLNAVSRGSNLYDRDQTIALNNVATISPSLFDETRFQYTRSRLTAPVNDLVGPAVNISGVASFGTAGSSPTGRDIDLYEFVNNVSVQHGAHTVKAGVDFQYNDINIVFPGILQGQYTFSSMSNFLAGRYTNFQQAFGPAAQPQTNPNVGVYVQDEWRVNSRLTLNAGVRYDLQFLASPVQTDTNNIAPRFGIAWSPTDSRKTVIRASYGLYYDRIPLRALSNALQRGGTTYQTAVLTQTQAGAPVFPFVLPNFPAGVLTNISTIDPHVKDGYSQQASLEIEQQLNSKTTVSIGYQHLRGLNLLMSRNLNVPTCSSGFNLCRPNPAYGNNSQYQSIGDSYFDGLTVSFVQRPVRWGNYRVSYTYSKAIDDLGAFFFSSPQNNFNVAADRGLSDNDQRNRIVFSGTVQTPSERGSSLWTRVRNGFLLSTIFTYYSPLPFNIQTGSDNNGDTNTNDRPAGLGRNTGRGFNFSSLDMRLSRTFSLGEHIRLEGLVEAFNLLNRRNNEIPNNIFGNGSYPNSPAPGFGTATAVGDPREIQIGLRLKF
jgi:carboxypeptidase family protein